jgi:hypothetical protein
MSKPWKGGKTADSMANMKHSEDYQTKLSRLLSRSTALFHATTPFQNRPFDPQAPKMLRLLSRSAASFSAEPDTRRYPFIHSERWTDVRFRISLKELHSHVFEEIMPIIGRLDTHLRGSNGIVQTVKKLFAILGVNSDGIVQTVKKLYAILGVNSDGFDNIRTRKFACDTKYVTEISMLFTSCLGCDSCGRKIDIATWKASTESVESSVVFYHYADDTGKNERISLCWDCCAGWEEIVMSLNWDEAVKSLNDNNGVPETAMVLANASAVSAEPPSHHEETAIVKRKAERQCIGCGKTGQIKQCSGCHKVALCSKECARVAWPTHKTDCRKWALEESNAKKPV